MDQTQPHGASFHLGPHLPCAIYPQDQGHLPRVALPLPGPAPVSPDSGTPRACPATFRGGLCKHGVPPRQPPWALSALVPGKGVWAGDREPGRVPAACPRTHPQGGLPDLCLWRLGVLLSTSPHQGQSCLPGVLWLPGASQMRQGRSLPLLRGGYGVSGPSPALRLARLTRLVHLPGQAPSPVSWCLPEMQKGHSQPPAPCYSKEPGFSSTVLGQSQEGSVVSLGLPWGADPERPRRVSDQEEGATGQAWSWCAEGHGEPLAVSCTEPSPGCPVWSGDTAWIPPWPHLSPPATSQPHQPTVYPFLLSPNTSPWLCAPLIVSGYLFFILQLSALGPPPPGSLPGPRSKPDAHPSWRRSHFLEFLVTLPVTSSEAFLLPDVAHNRCPEVGDSSEGRRSIMQRPAGS